MLGPVQQRISKGNAVRLQFVDTIGNNQPLTFIQCRGGGKQRCRVPVWSEAEQDQIEDGICSKRFLDLLLRALCGFIGRVFSMNAMDVALRNQSACEKR